MIRLLGALVTALLAWCGVVQTAQAAVLAITPAAVAYAYDSHATSADVLRVLEDPAAPVSRQRRALRINAIQDSPRPPSRARSEGPGLLSLRHCARPDERRDPCR